MKVTTTSYGHSVRVMMIRPSILLRVSCASIAIKIIGVLERLVRCIFS